MEETQQKKKNKLPRWTRILLVSVVCVLIQVVTSMASLAEAGSFEDYHLGENNDLTFDFMVKNYTGSNNNNAIRYHISSWYMFAEKISRITKDSSIKKSYYDTYGQKVTATTIATTAPASDGTYLVTKQINAEDLIEFALGKGEFTRLELTQGISLFFNPVTFIEYYNESGTLVSSINYWVEGVEKTYYTGNVYNRVDLLNAAPYGWSPGTTTAFTGDYYNQQIDISFQYCGLSYDIVDANGNPISQSGMTVNHMQNYEGYALYGETIGASNPDNLGAISISGTPTGYTYLGYYWSDTLSVYGLDGTGRTVADKHVTYDTIQATGDNLTLYFVFAENVPVVTPAIPTEEPTPAPPTPTPVPSTSTSVTGSYVYYFTTDLGFSMERVADSSAYYLANQYSSQASTVNNSPYTSRTIFYSIGTDASGNTWFFIEDGTNATYVHPYVYQGFNCTTSDIQYVTELTFPSAITYNSKTYSVTSIGGGTAKYKQEYSNSTDSWNALGYGYSTTYQYGISSGYYSYTRYAGTTGVSSTNISENVRYLYGVLGNGKITSTGWSSVFYETTYATQDRDYERSYYFYNTTLTDVTIPNTVTEILPGAFAYCQALARVHGGDSVTTIGTSAFEAAAWKASRFSKSWISSGVKSYDYYYYNLSYSVTDYAYTEQMIGWETTSKLCSSLTLPELPSLSIVGNRSFALHTNLGTVILPSTVTQICREAFVNCLLDGITIPGNPTIYNAKETLGTNGTGADRTCITTNLNTTAFTYGTDYKANYRLKSGYPVTYLPNGGVGDAVMDYTTLVFRPFTVEQTLTLTSNSENYHYILDQEGTLWYLDTTKLKLERVLYQEISNLLTVSSNVAVFTLNNGNLLSLYQNYATHSQTELMAEGYVDSIIQCSRTVAVYLGTDGYLYKATETACTKLTTLPIIGTGTYQTKSIYVLSDGTLWYYAGSKLYQLIPSSAPTTTIQMVGGTTYGSVAIEKTTHFIDTNGKLWTYQYNSTTKTYAWGVERLLTFNSPVVESKLLYCSLYQQFYFLSCENGDGYLMHLPTDDKNRTTYAPTIQKLLSAPEGIKEANYVQFSTSSGDSSNGILYIEDKAGHMWTARISYKNKSGIVGAVAEGKVLKQVAYDLNGASTTVMVLDEDGQIWSAGYNNNGRTGDTFTYELAASVIKYSLDDFVCVSDTTFTEFRMQSSSTVALGTDGYLYVSGYARAAGESGTCTEFVKTTTLNGITAIGGIDGYFFTEPGALSSSNVTRTADTGYDTFVTTIANPFTKLNHDFIGWNTKADGSGTAYAQGTTFAMNSSLILYAQWKNRSNIVFYHGNGGNSNGLASISKEYAPTITKVTLCSNLFTRQGYTGLSPVWNTKADGSGTSYAAGAAVPINGELHLYVQWRPIRYTVHFAEDAYGLGTEFTTELWNYGEIHTVPGEPYSKAYTVSYDLNQGEKSTIPVMLTTLTDINRRASFTFSGWRIYRNITTLSLFQSRLNGLQLGSATADRMYDLSFTDLYRQYVLGDVVKNLTSTDGEELTFFPVWGGAASYVTLPIAECVGYDFYGWTTSATETDLNRVALAGEDMDSKYQPRGNELLYAFFLPKVNEVVLDGRGAVTQLQTKAVMTFDTIVPEVVIPEKTGYTFHGYYTETRGNGVQYYDETGTGTREWLSDSLTVEKLYAYWVQNEIILPEEEDVPAVTPLPECTYTVTIGDTDTLIDVYASDYDSATNAQTDHQPYFATDLFANNTLVASGSIPSTEFICLRAKLGKYNFSSELTRHTGTSDVRFYVTIPYRTQYELEDETLIISDVKIQTLVVTLPKAWSYWGIDNCGLFTPTSLLFTNDALSCETVSIPINIAAGEMPSYSVTTSSNLADHVSYPTYDSDGVMCKNYTITEVQYIISNVVGSEPNVTPHLQIIANNKAYTDTSTLTVKSDKLVIEGITVLSDSALSSNGSAVDSSKVLQLAENVPKTDYTQCYASDIALDISALNGSHSSSAVLTFSGVSSNVGTPSTFTSNVVVNDIIIHTPVACDGSVTVDGTTFSDASASMCLNKNYNPLSIIISNKGEHKLSLGYGLKDFAHGLSGKSNISTNTDSVPMNAVKFPFGVFGDASFDSFTTDGVFTSYTGDKYFPADTWIVIGTASNQFYVPCSTKPGSYQIEFMSVAVNCPRNTDGSLQLSNSISQISVNKDITKYIALDSIVLDVCGAVSDVTVISSTDDSANDSINSGNLTHSIGLGYSATLKITTVDYLLSTSTSKLFLEPHFSYLPVTGTVTYPVDVFYNDVVMGTEKHFVKVGSEMDISNVHNYTNTNTYLDISSSLLRATGVLRNNTVYEGCIAETFQFSKILLNYCAAMMPLHGVTDLPLYYCDVCYECTHSSATRNCGHTGALLSTFNEKDFKKSIQEWYGVFFMPAETFVIASDTMCGQCSTCNATRYVCFGNSACPTCGSVLSNLIPLDFATYASLHTMTGNEEFLLRSGSLCVTFDVTATDGDSESIAYLNWENSELGKQWIADGHYSFGDVLHYDLGRSAKDDYAVGGTE